MSAKRKKIFWLSLAALNLVLAAYGANGRDFRELGTFGHVLRYWNIVSGGEAGFGFFAPGIGGQQRLQFDMVDASGKTTKIGLGENLNQEAKLRFDSILDNVIDADDSEDGEVKRALFASLAAKIFTQHRDAREVVVRLENYEPVSSAEFRAGKRTDWKEEYQARFGYSPRAARKRVQQ